MKKVLFVVLTALLSTTAYANNCAIYFDLDNFDKAFVACKQEAEQGDSRAQFYLALLYGDGKGVKVNKEKALYWYTQAAERGVRVAQYHLARIYESGDGVEVNKEQALNWYTQAAKVGYVLPQLELVYMYDQGKGIEVNKEEARYWYSKAKAKVKDNLAGVQYHLARIYDEGKDAVKVVKVNKEKALYWYTKAADWENTYAMYRLGIMYYEGDGVEKNSELAKKYFEQACELKFKESCEILHKGL